jgi:uncharacterized membrane protein
MPEIFGVPIHPALSHLPIASALLAAAALTRALTRTGAERLGWTRAARLLLLVALVAAPFSIWTGHAWADSLGLLPHGEWLPPATIRAGLLRRHVLSAAAGMALLVLSLLSLRVKKQRFALILVVAAALAMLLTGHWGGAMVHTATTAR